MRQNLLEFLRDHTGGVITVVLPVELDTGDRIHNIETGRDLIDVGLDGCIGQ